MNDNFAKWYRQANIPITDEIMTLRQEVLDEIIDIKKMNQKTILEILNIFYDLDDTEESISVIVEEFQKNDSTFAEDKIQEIRILAGLMLIRFIEERNDILSLSTFNQCYLFLGISPAIPEIAMYVKEQFEQSKLFLRENIVSETKKNLTPLKQDLFNITEDSEIVYNEDTVMKLTEVLKKINEICKNIKLFQTETFERELILQEDSQILWWMITEYSEAAQKKYCDLNQFEAPFFAGRDLADKVKVAPGPYSYTGVLSKLLSGFEDKTYVLEEYVDNCTDEFIEQLMSFECDTPLIFALKQKKLCGEKNWYKIFDDKFKGREKKLYNSIDIAVEMYVEYVLAKNEE